MDTASEVLLQLADPDARSGVLTSDALLAVATVCYELDPALVTDPVTATYDRFDIAVPLMPEMVATARVTKAGEPVPWEVVSTWDTTAAPAPAADAVWAGNVVVRTAIVSDVIDSVVSAQPDLDAAFAAALAGLPASATPEQVRAALREAARSGLTTPPLTDTELDALLLTFASGSADPRALGKAVSGRDLLGTQLQMSAPGQDPPPAPVALPVLVAFLVADQATTPRQLLQATASARRAARPYTIAAAPAGAPARRVERCVCWVLPASAFDDSGWPGAAGGTPADQRAARLAAARGWLATQGIAVVTTEEAP